MEGAAHCSVEAGPQALLVGEGEEEHLLPGEEVVEAHPSVVQHFVRWQEQQQQQEGVAVGEAHPSVVQRFVRWQEQQQQEEGVVVGEVAEPLER